MGGREEVTLEKLFSLFLGAASPRDSAHAPVQTPFLGGPASAEEII